MLFDLEDILSKITVDEFIFKSNEFKEMLLHLIDEYITNEPCAILEPDFHETITEQLKDILLQQFSHEIFFKEKDVEDLEEVIEETMDLFYELFMPPRSLDDSCILFHHTDVSRSIVANQIHNLKNKPQPKQRTKEWYIFRHNLITASNAYKAFGSGSKRNQLIYEKCNPLSSSISSDADPDQNNSTDNSTNKIIILEEKEKDVFVNVNSPLHWGQKYEPVSIMLYEELFNTRIEDFGCIQHDKYPFLGASPDGINVDSSNDRYGRMLEIKNIVNRVIDGIPKIEYWIQMQLQMETCDLDECDFLETQFKEYETELEYFNDVAKLSSKNDEFSNVNEHEDEDEDEDEDVIPKTKMGIIMYFTQKNKPIYKYVPFHIGLDKNAFDLWELQQMEEQSLVNNDILWIKNIYWRLEDFSCVLVQRNKRWFQDNIHTLASIWDIIERERKTGYEHRAPNKRVNKLVAEEKNIRKGGCFIKLSKDTGKVEIS